MIRAVLVAVLSLAGAVHAAPATAKGYMTGQQLLEACDHSDLAWISFCQGYIEGVDDAYNDVIDVCYPPEETRGQIGETVKEALQADANLRAARATTVVVTVLQRVYPCQ